MENSTIKEQKSSGLIGWIDARFPFSSFITHHLKEYYAPKNLNFWYVFGAISLLVLVNQIVTGIWLAMYYTPTAKGAFASIEFIMRDVHFGWLIRYMHAVGASAFFVVVYLHMYRALMYGSYKRPRELLWLFGMVIYCIMLGEAFTGYVLPWGQMSYWASQVITSLFGAIPYIGHDITIFLRGDFNVSGVTLHRCFSLHVILFPLIFLALVAFHLVGLHKVGSNNPDGIEIRKDVDEKGVPKDGIPFHPYFTLKDLYWSVIFLIVFAAIIFFNPNFWGYFIEGANSVPANPIVTPAHIAPIWYMTPYYAILRAIPNKLGGAIFMAASIAFLFVLPWLDRSKVKSIRYKGKWSKWMLAIFVISFIGLGWLGLLPVDVWRLWLARLFTVGYFAFFVLMPFYTRWENTKPEPARVKFKKK